MKKGVVVGAPCILKISQKITIYKIQEIQIFSKRAIFGRGAYSDPNQNHLFFQSGAYKIGAYSFAVCLMGTFFEKPEGLHLH